MASQKVGRVHGAVRQLITKSVQIEVHARVPGSDGCVDGRLCLHCRWRRGPPVYCPLHGPDQKHSVHERVSREAVHKVYCLDKLAAVLPAFRMRCAGVTRRKGKPVRGPALELDVLFVLSSGVCLALEVDGRSHNTKTAKRKDAQKAVAVNKCGVKLFRIDLRQNLTPQFEEFEHVIADNL